MKTVKDRVKCMNILAHMHWSQNKKTKHFFPIFWKLGKTYIYTKVGNDKDRAKQTKICVQISEFLKF